MGSSDHPSSARRTPRLVAPWPLGPDAERELERRRADRRLSDVEARRLREFGERGFVVIERAIAPVLVDALVRDVRRIADHPGHFLTTAHRVAKSYQLSDAAFGAYESIFDTYVNLESARRVSLHPTVTRFLELVFDEPVIAFQQLLFQRSNGHGIHQDTSVVCVDEPLLLVATWIALEDVVPGRGELTYFEGSHRIPHYLFADGTKRRNPAVDDEAALRAYLRAQLESLGCKKRDFIAKKGDVLFWAADLVHASNPRTRPEEETRMSLVTHYCPSRTRPFWMRLLPEHRHVEAVAQGASIASQYYRLPLTDTFGRPRLP